MKQERILCAAVNYIADRPYDDQPEGIDHGYVVSGYNHDEIHSLTDQIVSGHDYTSFFEEGFLTSFNRFVDRKEAFKIALDTGLLQVEDWNGARTIKSHRMNGELSSEDLY